MFSKENINLINSVDDFLRFGYSKSFKFINPTLNETNFFLVNINEKQIAIPTFYIYIEFIEYWRGKFNDRNASSVKC